MKQRVRTIDLAPCGCGHEGTVTFRLLDTDTEIACSYIAINDEAIRSFYRVGVEALAEIQLSFGNVARTNLTEVSLNPAIVGRFAGIESVEDNDLIIMTSIFTFPIDNELGDSNLQFQPGDWITATGEFTVSLPNNTGEQVGDGDAEEAV